MGSLSYDLSEMDLLTGLPTNYTDCDTIFFEFYSILNESIGFAFLTSGKTEQACHYFGGVITVSYSGTAILGSGSGAVNVPKDLLG